MRRAAVLIGVDRAGDLPALKDAATGARRMAAWAREQQMDPVHVFTDEQGGSVDVWTVKHAVRDLVEVGHLDQLVVYFAGHGLNRNFGEYWLLTEAPGDTQAAVNMQASAMLAAHCGVPHVILISDTCRTAAEGIGAQHLRGSEIFPNIRGGGREQPVDQFFACRLGCAALEVRDPVTTAGEYTAVYTGALLDALEGRCADALEWAKDESIGYLRPGKLKRYLEDDVPRRLGELRLSTRVIQRPDARILSDEQAWVARHVMKPPEASGPLGPSSWPESSVSLTNRLSRRALAEDPEWMDRTLHSESDDTMLGARDLTRSVLQIAQPFDRCLPDDACGFEVRGCRLRRCVCFAAKVELVEGAVRVHGLAPPGATVLLVFEDGEGVALPAIPGFTAGLTMQDRELVDVAYEPSGAPSRPRKRNGEIADARTLGALASSSTRSGAFRLEGAEADAFTRAMGQEALVDPALAIYAAYSYQGPRRAKLLRALMARLREDFGAPLYDIAMLTRTSHADTLGFAPLLAPGWPLLPALRSKLVAPLERLDQTVLPSVWTLYDANGVEMIIDALQSGAVR